MEIAVNNTSGSKQNEEALYTMLERGIEDMEKGRELPLEQAFEKISELRNLRRNAKI